jgi:hypothetical protein
VDNFSESSVREKMSVENLEECGEFRRVWRILTSVENLDECGEFSMLAVANINHPVRLHVCRSDKITKFCKTYEGMSVVNQKYHDEIIKRVRGDTSTVQKKEQFFLKIPTIIRTQFSLAILVLVPFVSPTAVTHFFLSPFQRAS